MIERRDITGVVLAGGQGQRMGGADKGLLAYQGQTLVAHALARLAPQVEHLIISANRNLGLYAQHGHTVVSDEATDFPGPLAGLLAALRICATPWLATVPCDCPWFPLDLVARLAQAVQGRQPPALLATVITAGDPTHPKHPVFCLAHRSLQPDLEAYLGHGGRAMQRWLAQAGALQVPFDEPQDFLNINTPQDLAGIADPLPDSSPDTPRSGIPQP